MTTRKFLIAGGNATALVRDCPPARRASLAADLLREVEQVGFVDHQAHPPRLEMMGGEFCINATLAFASTLGPNGTLGVSGLDQSVDFVNTPHAARVTIPLRWSLTDNIALLEGIGFILHPTSDGHAQSSTTNHPRIKREVADLCGRFDLPAFGAIHFSDDAIIPYVYVAAVDSFVPETACGSGSVAFSLFTGQDRVRQPTGQFITVRRRTRREREQTGHDHFDVEARVEQIPA
ncbi:hypothetical protein [Desulfonatronum sp. SC1]|uniref:hypothetical protein n=1 Tax=Desulfonatronum sp. SC1 TaxID=2109626 RepID=UPI000D316F81|nr:hypothetical protein [Desulfonatronum sp. SC1]PTN32233.1 hypothetical protein C6366_16785 [Desulfonatronum sp. SC1]